MKTEGLMNDDAAFRLGHNFTYLSQANWYVCFVPILSKMAACICKHKDIVAWAFLQQSN